MRVIQWKIRNFGLKKKALIIFMLFIMLPTLGVGVLVQYRYNEVLMDQFITSTKRNLDTVTSRLEEQTSLVENIADYMILNPDMQELLRPNPPLSADKTEYHKRNIENFLTFQLMNKNYIKSISITGYNGNSVEMGEPIIGNENKWFLEANTRKGGIVWSEGYPSYSAWTGDVRLISMFRILNSYNNITQPLGRLVIRLDEANLTSLLESGIAKESGYLYVLGENGETVLQSRSSLNLEVKPDEKLLGLFSHTNKDFINYSINGKKMLTFYHHMENTNWKIMAMIPESVVNDQYRSVKLIMNIILAAILILGLLGLIGFQYTIIRPILRLKIETNRVKLGDFSAHVPIESNDEISELNRKFNEMVLTIKQLIEHKFKLELRERESELKLLQNQMDPHFLYNTLDMIRWTARLEKAKQSSQLIEMFSKFFRLGLSNGKYETTILKELEFVNSYLYLQQQRLGIAKFKYSLYTESTIANATTLKTTIQPLVENFLKHGYDRKKPINAVSVRCYRMQDMIWIEVKDNGKGFGPDIVQSINRLGHPSGTIEGRGGAMSNIHERISIHFGDSFGLEIVDPSDAGGWVRLKIPYSESKGGEQLE
ncbi:cache domain-containing sensor histidine kinase [Cohnella cholangitidis]|uniref:HAMP domain-containing protein n=1 Tax=Cohnella cholangitidis TaxID=2598458 RepID=A0A7G5C677_9BACL|nr:sensor histidine kinase [Cohnella cholangitidis]QMV44711.1 HAMP domain-containing protein [Cohnella cholangitidis]